MLERLAWHAVHATAPAEDRGAASDILQGRARRSPWQATYDKQDQPPPSPPQRPAKWRPQETERRRGPRRGRRRRTQARGAVMRPAMGPSSRGSPLPRCGPPWGGGPRPPGPGASPGPGRACRPGGATTCVGQLTPGRRVRRCLLAALLEPAQRPCPAGPLSQRHPPATPRASGLRRKGAFDHGNATPGRRVCHHAPGDSDLQPGAEDVGGRSTPGQRVHPLLQQLCRGNGLQLAGGWPPQHSQLQVRGRAQSARFTEIVRGKAAALEIRTEKGGLNLINAHRPQVGSSPWAGQAAFWTDVQMYAAARGLGGGHLVVVARDSNM